MRKKWMTVLCGLVLAASLGFSGCSPAEKPEQPQEMTCQAELYYVNEDAVVNGSGAYLMEEPIETKLTGMSDELLMKAVVESLKGIPGDRAGYATMMTEEMTVNGVSVKDGIASVDFSSEGMNGSSLEESLLIGQIVESLCETFDDVDSVQFLLDGKKADSLMGHVDTSKPIGEDYTKPLLSDDGGNILD